MYEIVLESDALKLYTVSNVYYIEFPNEKKYIHFFNSLEIVKVIESVETFDFMEDNDVSTLKYRLHVENIVPFDEYMNSTLIQGRLQYQDILKCVGNISQQCFYLEHFNMGFSHIDPGLIIVVNNSSYYYLGIEFCFNGETKKIGLIDEDGSEGGSGGGSGDGSGYKKQIQMFTMILNVIQIDRPLIPTFTMSPELIRQISKQKEYEFVPYKIPANNWVYSLGLFSIYCLSGKNDLENKTLDYYNELLDPIVHTKLWYAIQRCLNERVFLFV